MALYDHRGCKNSAEISACRKQVFCSGSSPFLTGKTAVYGQTGYLDIERK
ncbi:hypothetical protein [Massiliimalia timonensis]|nr:hypothetical protein [Massiliimalia timonensis]